MNSFTQLVQHVKNANWSGANQVFAEIMQQKVADRLAVERRTIFTEAAPKMAECLNCGTIFPMKHDVWSEQCPSCHSRGEANIAPVYKVKDVVQSLKKHGLHEDDTKYQEYFRSQLKKHGYDSPADIPDDKKDDFFNAVDKGYKAKNESVSRLREDKKPYVWECMHCGNLWRSTQGGNTHGVRCPKCHSDDVLSGTFHKGA